jgi:pimeloyl-ACP methyl ester carboxylesterase
MAVKLHYRLYGEGEPIMVLHGLFGLADNWQTFAKQMAQSGFAVYTIDLRNHGSSPHTSDFSYALMADDLFEFIQHHQLHKPCVMGHSMGGKAAMKLSLQHPDSIKALIVVDIAPRYYAPHHQTILSALQSVDLDTVSTRSEADKILAALIDDNSTRQFLLKNLFWQGDQLQWRFNLKSISQNIEEVGQHITSAMPFNHPTLFIRGEKSSYINEKDVADIKTLFPRSQIATAPNAGHWVHADQPEWIFNTVKQFLLSLPQA